LGRRFLLKFRGTELCLPDRFVTASRASRYPDGLTHTDINELADPISFSLISPEYAAKNKAGSAVCLTALPVLCFGE
jgi:hypothetical protein